MRFTTWRSGFHVIGSSATVATLAAILAGVSVARGATYTWSATPATTNWNTTDSNWTGAGAVWANGNDAEFGGTAGSTITIDISGISATSVTFNVTGDQIARTSTNDLTLTGAASVSVGTGLSNTISAPIAGTSGLTKLDNGVLTLSGANTYTGTTTVSGGTLALQNTNASGAYSIAGGATLEMNVASGTRDMSSASFSGTGTLQKTGTGTLVWGGAATTFSLSAGSVIDVQGGTFIGGSSANENWTTNQSGLNVATGALFNGVEANIRVGALTGTGTIRTGWAGAGYSTFTFGVGDASGSFGGTLSHNDGTAYGHYTKTGTGTQTFTGTINVIANGGGTGMTISGGTVELGGSGTFSGGSWTNAMLNNGTFHYNTTTNNNMSGVISGSGALNKSNTGTLTLSGSGANTYGGTTTVNGGTLALGKTAGVNAIAGDVTIGDGTGVDLLRLDASNQIANGSILTFNGSAANAGTFRLNAQSETVGGIVSSSGAGIVENGNSGTSTLTLDVNTTNRSFAGILQNGSGGTLALTKTGTATQTLTGATTYSGATNVSQGTLVLENTNASGSYAISGGATLEMNVASGSRDMPTASFSGAGILKKTGTGGLIWGAGVATFSFGSGAVIDVQEGLFTGGSFANDVWTNNKADLNVATGATFDAVEATAIGDGGVFVDALTGSGTIKVGYPGGYANKITFGIDNGSGTFNGSLQNSSATGSFVKAGTGTQTLTGASSYTGGTTITAGTLLANNTTGSATGTGGIVVNGGILGGTGAVSGGVTINNTGTLSPGASIESLATGALTFNNGSTFLYELNSTSLNGDLVVGAGLLAINPTSTLTLGDAAPGSLPLGSKLTLVNYSGAWNLGTFSGYADDSTFVLGANKWQINYNDTVGGSNFSGEQGQTGFNGYLTITVVPEPSAMALMLFGTLMLWGVRRRS